MPLVMLVYQQQPESIQQFLSDRTTSLKISPFYNYLENLLCIEVYLV